MTEFYVFKHKFPCFRKDKFILCPLEEIGKVGRKILIVLLLNGLKGQELDFLDVDLITNIERVGTEHLA